MGSPGRDASARTARPRGSAPGGNGKPRLIPFRCVGRKAMRRGVSCAATRSRRNARSRSETSCLAVVERPSGRERPQQPMVGRHVPSAAVSRVALGARVGIVPASRAPMCSGCSAVQLFSCSGLRREKKDTWRAAMPRCHPAPAHTSSRVTHPPCAGHRSARERVPCQRRRSVWRSGACATSRRTSPPSSPRRSALHTTK